MLNRNAIFVNGFSRGGTTMLTNLLASHPTVCLVGETHHVFKGHNITDSRWRVLNKCLYHDAPILMRHGQNFFSPRLVKPRKSLCRWSENRIDRILYREKLRSNHPLLNQYKTANLEYTREELMESRLLCKNIDGMIYVNDAFSQMYPDGTYFGLVRNGFAVCEGHVRRGRSAQEIGWRYRVLAEKMLSDAERFANYHMVRFEDLVADPMETVAAAYAAAGLDVDRLDKVRMQVRRVMDANGNHQLVGDSEWDVVWLTFSELGGYFKQDVNLNQIKRLSAVDRDAFLEEAGDVMERLGYPCEVSESRGYCVPVLQRQAKPLKVADVSRRAA
ncbi:MAG: sulfotransferase [Pirellulaceae bacterium]|nr:sulfotransferase [Pirellulaceae bacterium]